MDAYETLLSAVKKEREMERQRLDGLLPARSINQTPAEIAPARPKVAREIPRPTKA